MTRPSKEMMDRAAKYREHHQICFCGKDQSPDFKYDPDYCDDCLALATEFQRIAEERDERAAKMLEEFTIYHAKYFRLAAAIRAGGG